MLYNKKGVKKRDDEENDDKRMKIMKKNRPDDVSLRACSPFGGYRVKYTRDRHTRGDAPCGFAACSACFACPNRRACSQAKMMLAVLKREKKTKMTKMRHSILTSLKYVG